MRKNRFDKAKALFSKINENDHKVEKLNEVIKHIQTWTEEQTTSLNLSGTIFKDVISIEALRAILKIERKRLEGELKLLEKKFEELQ
jgi:hypothetical protein